MKKFVFPFLLLAALRIPAQFTNWGFGLPITVTYSGTTLSCSVTDPVTGTETMTQNDVDDYLNVDGRIIWSRASGYAGYIIYDVNQHQYETYSGSIPPDPTIVNWGGVQGWSAPSGSIGYAIYDPQAQSWKVANHSAGSNPKIMVSAGTFAWSIPSGTVGYGVYDPEAGSWRTGSFSAGSDPTLLTDQGIFAWSIPSGSIGYGIYDPEIGNWKTGSFSAGADPELQLDHGVFAWTVPSGSVGCGVYDPSLDVWKTTNFSLSGSPIATLSDGTVTFTSSSSTVVIGYNTSSQNWETGETTTLQCHPHHYSLTSGTNKFIYYSGISMGSLTASLDCGDGNTIYRWNGWKQYTTSGTYSLTQTVSNSSTNTTCDFSVTIGVGVHDPEQAIPVQVFPNPGTGEFHLELPDGDYTLIITDALGQKVQQHEAVRGSHFGIDLTGLPSGSYWAVAAGRDKRYIAGMTLLR